MTTRGDDMKKAELELCYLSATEALEKFHNRELSPVDIVKAQIARNEAIGDKLNATTYTFFERALKAAEDEEHDQVRLQPARDAVRQPEENQRSEECEPNEPA